MNNLKCFIAMPFKKKDCEMIYKKVIWPILKDFKVTPKRVDKIVHNDEITNKIYEYLEKCDFCIADLTYARPSVYYEAGYAKKKGEVLFICRQDHFDKKHEQGIHFDLRGRNILDWNERKLPSFQKEFRKHVKYILKKIDNRKKATIFEKLSLETKTEKVKTIFDNEFKIYSLYKEPKSDYRFRNRQELFYKIKKNSIFIPQNIYFRGINEKMIDLLKIKSSSWAGEQILKELTKRKQKVVKKIVNLVFLYSFNKINLNNLKQKLYKFHEKKDSYKNSYLYVNKDPSFLARDDKNRKIENYLYILDSIKTEKKYSDIIKNATKYVVG